MFLISSGLLKASAKAAWHSGEVLSDSSGARGECKSAVMGQGRRNPQQDVPLPPPLSCSL